MVEKTLVHTMNQCSAAKRNKIMIYATSWLDIKAIVLSENMSQSLQMYDFII